MKRLLVPTDFSPCAKNALAFAVQLAADWGNDTELVCLHVIENGESPAETESEVEGRLEGLLASLGELPAKVSASHKTRYGKVPDLIARTFEELGCDLIVMGASGQGGLRSKLLGSTTTQLIGDCPHPVLVVPAQAGFDGTAGTACALDFLSLDDRQVEKMVRYTQLLQSEPLCFFHVNVAHNPLLPDVVGELRKKYGILPLKPSFEVKEADYVLSGILDFVNTPPLPDFVCVFTRKRSFFEKLFETSYAEELALHSHIPLLVLHEEA